MSLQTSRPATRFAGLAMATVLGCGIALSGATGAFAATAASPAPTQPDNSQAGQANTGAASAALISQDAGSLTIHKLETPQAGPGTASNGLEDTSITGTAVPGAGFTVTKIDEYKSVAIDLKTDAGWKAAQDLQAAVSAAGGWDAFLAAHAADVTLGAATTVTTDAQGVAKADALDLGLYAATETTTPAGYAPSASFVAPVPMTDPTNLNSWNYDIHAYPKDDKVDATKTVVDAAATDHRSDVAFTITVDVPSLKAATQDFSVRDELDAALALDSVELAWKNGGDASADFDIVEPANGGHVLTVNAKTADAARADISTRSGSHDKLVVTVHTHATATAVVSNTAQVFTDHSSVDTLRKDPQTPINPQTGTPGTPGTPGTTPNPNQPTPAVTTNTVDTKWGSLTIEKQDLATANPLQGAEFQVFASEADAKAGTNPLQNLAGETTFATDANGIVDVDGLRYSDFANNQANPTTGAHSYWVVETKAPADHEISVQQPQEVTVVDADKGTVEVVFKDAKTRAGFEMPLTGGTGTVMLTIVGLTALGGAGAIVASRRRRDEA